MSTRTKTTPVTVFCFLVLSITTASIAQNCDFGDCKDGIGRLITPDGRYTGAFVNGIRSGQGKFISNNGIEISGLWSTNQRLEGKCTWKTGESWEGGLVVYPALQSGDGKFTVHGAGKGVLRISDNERYEMYIANSSGSIQLIKLSSFNWPLPSSVSKIDASGQRIPGTWDVLEGFISNTELERRRAVALAVELEKKRAAENQAFSLAVQQAQSTADRDLAIGLQWFVANGQSFSSFVSATGTPAVPFVDFTGLVDRIKLDQSSLTPGYIRVNGKFLYNNKALLEIDKAARLKGWRVPSLSDIDGRLKASSKIPQDCYGCTNGKTVRKRNCQKCERCWFITDEERRGGVVCPDCRNSREVNCERVVETCDWCNGTGKRSGSFDYAEGIRGKTGSISLDLTYNDAKGKSKKVLFGFAVAEKMGSDGATFRLVHFPESTSSTKTLLDEILLNSTLFYPVILVKD
jgi:hypothetical protein